LRFRTSLREFVCLGLEIREVNLPPFEHDAAIHKPAHQGSRRASRRDRSVMSDAAERVPVDKENGGIEGIAEPRRALGHGGQYRLDVGRRARDHPQNLRRRRLLFPRLAKLTLQTTNLGLQVYVRPLS
jgi:hypothetical protein